jgi:hypothetical protein
MKKKSERAEKFSEISELKVFSVQDALNELLSPVVSMVSIPRGRFAIGDADKIRTFAKDIPNSKVTEEKYYIEITK